MGFPYEGPPDPGLRVFCRERRSVRELGTAGDADNIRNFADAPAAVRKYIDPFWAPAKI